MSLYKVFVRRILFRANRIRLSSLTSRHRMLSAWLLYSSRLVRALGSQHRLTNQKAPRVGCADPSRQVELRVTSSDDGDGGEDLSIRPLTYKGGGARSEVTTGDITTQIICFKNNLLLNGLEFLNEIDHIYICMCCPLCAAVCCSLSAAVSKWKSSLPISYRYGFAHCLSKRAVWNSSSPKVVASWRF